MIIKILWENWPDFASHLSNFFDRDVSIFSDAFGQIHRPKGRFAFLKSLIPGEQAFDDSCDVAQRLIRQTINRLMEFGSLHDHCAHVTYLASS